MFPAKNVKPKPYGLLDGIKMEEKCPFCFGSGNVECSFCGGSGREECTCLGFNDDCPFCHGSGIGICSFCGGSGSEDCIYCDGSGFE